MEVGGGGQRGRGEEEEQGEEGEQYQPPPPRSIDELLGADQGDEALRRYKEALLGGAVAGSGAVVADQADPRKVIVKSIDLVVEGRQDDSIDLTQDLKAIKARAFVLQEAAKFRMRINFVVQREIVHGLRYVQKTKKMMVTVDKMEQMIGSFPPSSTPHSFLTAEEEAPSGMMGRGAYAVTSVFTDDDKTEHLRWEWNLEIRKDWA